MEGAYVFAVVIVAVLATPMVPWVYRWLQTKRLDKMAAFHGEE